MKKGALFFSALLLASSLNVRAETGWLKKRRKGLIYFKPFVTVTSPDTVVIFITPEGKVYRGTCRKKTFLRTCRVTPGKRFDSPYAEIRYIVLKISPPEAPEILKTGIVKEKIKGE
ncbi:hypothetical protein [Desulfurobacterium sp.]|uniref:hypothetical protein n=1 Tax=Desulfurobacterium sp. TaxID=2004706 RepID=UPI002629F5DF|nr:hypothetical protein [Desulfurobacterium sp.]